MATTERPASFLPTIKCSSCGRQVEISMMGEHICATDTKPPQPAPLAPLAPQPSSSPTDSLDYHRSYNSSNNYSSSPTDSHFSRGQDRLGRLPPQVDTSVANKSYYRTGQLTPVSTSSGSQSVSPRTPSGLRIGSGYGGGRLGDDYYSPRVAGEFDSPISSSASSLSQPRQRLNINPADDLLLDPSSYPPAASSPKSTQNLLQRMNSIAPGPFDINRKPTNARSKGFPRSTRESSSSSSNNGAATIPPVPVPVPIPVLPTLQQDRLGDAGNGDDNDDDDFAVPTFERAGTFPRLSQTQNANAPSRTPSEPGQRPERRRYPSVLEQTSTPSSTVKPRLPSMGPDTSRRPPPRTSLLRQSGRNSSNSSNGSSGNVPQINLAAEFGVDNPYHSPSESMSSTVSSMSRPGVPFSSSASSLSSASSFGSANNNSSNKSKPTAPVTNIDSLLEDLQSMTTQGPSDPVSPMSPGLSGLPESSTLSTSGSSVSPGSTVSPLHIRREQSPERMTPAQPKSYGEIGRDLERPMSRGRNLQSQRRDLSQQSQPTQPTQPSQRARSQYPESRRREASQPRPDSQRARSQHPDVTQQRRAYSSRQDSLPLPSRGNCKACGEPITGKSVSSADGRLTGRYHKACFVCTTCSEPFSSATFYVHDDKPYCERHYHKINGSLCGTCGNGIEGEYLADDEVHSDNNNTKYHPQCFACAGCGVPLRDGYFEVGGKRYCERDAWKRVESMDRRMEGGRMDGRMDGRVDGRDGRMDGRMEPPMDRRVDPRMNMNHRMDNRMYQRGPMGPPSGLPSGPRQSRPNGKNGNLLTPMGGGNSMGMGGMGGMNGMGGMGMRGGPFGMPGGISFGPGSRPRMEKRMTRLGMM